MSKSYGNTINFFDLEKDLKKSVMSIVSDSFAIEEAKNPDTSVIYSIYSLFLDPSEKENLKERFRLPGLRYGDIKKELYDKIMDHFAPYRTKRESLLKNPSALEEILKIGSQKAKFALYPTLEKLNSLLGLKINFK